MDRKKLFAHTSPEYTKELINLHDQIIEMSKIVSKQVEDSFSSLLNSNIFVAKEVIANDQEVNEYEKKIDHLTTLIIARRQPAANDLRMLISSLKLTQDLERIGDEAKRFASLSALIINDPIPNTNDKVLNELTELTKERLERSITALKIFDVSQAMIQLRKDAGIEVEMRRLQSELCKEIIKKPESAPHFLRINNCIRACERIADRCSNICEFIIFQIHGLDIRHAIDTEFTP